MIKQLRRRTDKGMTFIEIMFVILALSLFFTALFRITIGGLQAYNRGVVQATMKNDMRRTVERISVDLRQAVPSTGSDGFISPERVTTATDSVQDLEFYRYSYDSSIAGTGGETSQPTANVKVKYYFSESDKTYISRKIRNPVSGNLDTVSYVIGKLSRQVTDGNDAVTEEFIAHNVVFTENGTKKSYFKWAQDPVDTTTTQANINVMEIHLKLIKFDGGAGNARKFIPEELEFTTDVSLRADRKLTGGSNYSPSSSNDYTTNVQNFGIPASLERPDF